MSRHRVFPKHSVSSNYAPPTLSPPLPPSRLTRLLVQSQRRANINAEPEGFSKPFGSSHNLRVILLRVR